MQSPCPSSERPPQLSYMEVLRYHELCQTLYGGPLLGAAPWLPLPTQVTWTESGQMGQLGAPPPPPPAPTGSPSGDCSSRPAAQEANTGRSRVSDFSIEGILAGRRTAEPAAGKEPEYDWLNCTRYKPPKLPRAKKEGVQKRRLGRNPRIPFSSHQIALLEHKFRHKQYLSSYDVTELASLLCLSQTRVKIWFQNRRARERRDHESRSRTVLPAVSSQTVLPFIPPPTVLPSISSPTVLPSISSPTVLSSVRSAFHPVSGVVTSPEVTMESHVDQESALRLDTAPEELRYL